MECECEMFCSALFTTVTLTEPHVFPLSLQVEVIHQFLMGWDKKYKRRNPCCCCCDRWDGRIVEYNIIILRLISRPKHPNIRVRATLHLIAHSEIAPLELQPGPWGRFNEPEACLHPATASTTNLSAGSAAQSHQPEIAL